MKILHRWGPSENDSLYSASSPSVQVDGGGELGGPGQDEGDDDDLRG